MRDSFFAGYYGILQKYKKPFEITRICGIIPLCIFNMEKM